MWNGAEAYLQMWERAVGIRRRAAGPRRGRVTADGPRPAAARRRWEKLLRRAGQPQQRTRAWSWCVRGKQNRRAADVAELSQAGRVELVGSTARGRSAGGIAVGDAASDRPRPGPAVGGGVFVRAVGPTTFVYALRGGASAPSGSRPRGSPAAQPRLRKAMLRVAAARAANIVHTFVPNPRAGSRVTGTTLAGSSNPRLDRAFVMLCALGR